MKILLYRGVNQSNYKYGRTGRWWTTNPYYAYRHSNNGKGMYVAKIDEIDLKRLSTDVSIEEDFQNYYFRDIDPPGNRQVTSEEIKRLLRFATFSKGTIGGTMMKQPNDPIKVGRSIFG